MGRIGAVSRIAGLVGMTLACGLQGKAHAQNAPGIQQLEQQLQQQQQQLESLQRELQRLQSQRSAAPATPTTATTATTVPTVAPAPHTAEALTSSFGPSGFTLRSADGANVIHLRGNVSVDGRFFTDGKTRTAADTWLVRKLRPTLEGTLGGRYDFRFMPDFGQGKAILQDGWADARIRPWLIFEVGKFKAPVGLERLQLEQNARFIEAGLPADLLPYRDLGMKVGGTLASGLLSYDIGNVDGAPDGLSMDGNAVPDANSTGHFTWEARVFAQPFLHTPIAGLQQLGLGAAETYVTARGAATATGTTSLLASYKTPGMQPLFSYRSNTASGYNNATIAAGVHRRLVPQAWYYYGPVGLLAEYALETQQVQRQISPGSERHATLQNSAWQVQGYWYLTGEQESYTTAGPRRAFGSGGPGAWELVARYSEIRFDAQTFSDATASFADPASAPRAARAIGVGLNWYLTQNFKVQLDYEVTHFEGGAPAGNRPAERVLTSQFSLIF
jgi:phosphate-selective porin OprO/OprP